MSIRLLRLGWALALCSATYAQSLVEPERIAGLQQAFDSAAEAPQLRCRMDAVRPALDYAFRFHTGYVIEFPMLQFQGAGHSLNTFLRVTPEGQKPAYFENTGNLAEVPATKLDGQIAGTFVVGEGTYEVEALIEDDAHRVCRSKWRIQARRTGIERELTATTPAGAVEELNVNSNARLPIAEPSIGRLTILLHAAPLSPRAPKLQDADVSALVGSIDSLLQQIPAQSVRLVVFNVAQRAVPFRQDGFTVKDLDKVIAALNQLELAKVDYRTLQQSGSPAAMLTDLVKTELQDPHSADALILMGPRLQMRDDTAIPALDKPPGALPGLFYLQYQPQLRMIANGQGLMGGGRGGRGGGQINDPSFGDLIVVPMGTSDTVEKLVTRLKGKTFAVRVPHDLADGIRHIQAAIPKLAVEKSATPPPKFTTPAETAVEDHPAPAKRPAVTDRSPAEGPLNLPESSKLPPANPSLTDTDPVDLLMRLRDQVLAHAVRIPNHTCVETIQRDRFEPIVGRAGKSCDNILASRQRAGYQPRLRLDITDRLRLDVAMAPDREIFSWAGASKFEEGDIDELVPEGAIGTGSFASFLLSTFEGRGPQFVYEGDTAEGGRTLMEYSFHVARDDSHYRVKAHKEWIITGYTGALSVDAKTAELVRLTIRTEELPPETSTCETDTSLEYASVQLGADGYLLPKMTRQRFIGRDGSEAENTTTFSACREYHAESTLTFEGSAGAAGYSRAGGPPAVLDLPPGLAVTVELMTAVDNSRAAAGDQIEGRLIKPIRDGKQKTLVPEGASVHGRLMRVETRHSSPPDYTVVLRWETVEIDGRRVPISLRPDHRAGNLADMGSMARSGLHQRGMTIELPLPTEGNYGVYRSHKPGLERGLKTEWLTAR